MVFFRKVQLSLTLGIIFAFLFIGGVIYFKQYTDVKHQLKSQGAVLTANLAFNAEPFIVDYDKDQLNQFLEAMLGNPLVLFSGIINTRYTGPNIDVLQKQDRVNLKFVTDVVRQPNYGNIQAAYTIQVNDDQIKDVIYCVAPIMSDFKYPDDETTLLYAQPKHRGIIGYSVIAYRMPWEQLFSVKIQWVAMIFVLFAVVFGSLLGQLISNQFTGRIRQIHSAIASYSFGEVIQIDDPNNDEISDISVGLAGLTEMVAMQLNKMTKLNKDLEDRVADRVSEIEDLNQALTSFSNNQRAFIGQTVQELKSLIHFLPLLENDPTAYSNLMRHVQLFLDRLLSMVKHNREFSSLGEVTDVNVQQLLNDAQPLFDALAQKNKNQLIINCDSTLVIQTDALQLKQSIIQLIHNATKYTEHGRVELNVSHDEKNAYFKIVDTGIGMDQTKVNDVLTQLDNNDMGIMDAFSTLGLGLVLTHRFCRNIKAKLICVSQLGAGCTIEVIHPIKQPYSQELSSVVVCYSDNSEQLVAMKSAIQAISGWDAIDWDSPDTVKHAQPAFVLLDLASAKVYEQLKAAKEQCVRTKLLIVSGHHLVPLTHLVEAKPSSIHKTIERVLYGHVGAANILYSGLDPTLIAALEQLSIHQFSSSFPYNDPVALRLIHESSYRTKDKRSDLMLVYESAESLRQLIQEKDSIK